MSDPPTSTSKWMQTLRYGRQTTTLGDEIAALRAQLCISVRLPEGSTEASDLNSKRDELLQAANHFPHPAKLRQYLFHAHGIAPEWELLPPCMPHKPEPPIEVLCPECDRAVLMSVEVALWDGCVADGQSASGISEHGTCPECGTKLRRSKTTIPILQENWGPWHKELG